MGNKLLKDLLFCAAIIIIVAPFFLFEPAMQWFKSTTSAHPYAMAFLKFFILSTLGEMTGLRIQSGVYSYKGFGLLPRAIVWGFFGVLIAVAMKIFSTGVPVMLESFGLNGCVAAMAGGFTLKKFIGALFISTFMNSLFAPVFMTLHKISDTNILANGGSLWRSITRPIPFGEAFVTLNWKVQWNFVFKKTIPLFWIPAHTITFLLPASMQVLFAASLSIVLGTLLSIAAVMSRKQAE